MSERTPASAARRSSRRERMVESSVLQVADELLGRALVRRELDRAVLELALGGLDGAHDVPVAAGDGAHHGQLRDQVAEVGGAEDGVHGGHVVVLVHGDGPRGERGAGQAELLVREALEPAVLLELPAHGLEPARRARVPRDGGADLRVEARDLRGDGLGLVAVLLERRGPRPGRSGRQRHGGRERAEREERGQRQATYRMALVQCASSEACGSRRSASGPPRPGSGPAEGQSSKPSTLPGTAQAQESRARSRRVGIRPATPSRGVNGSLAHRHPGRSGRPSSSTTSIRRTTGSRA